MSGRYLDAHDDPGAQPERTHLAWLRTMLATGIVGLLAVRLGTLVGASPFLVVGIVVVIMVMVGASQVRRHRIAVAGMISGALKPAAGSVFSLGAGVILLGVAALVFLASR